MGTDNIFGHDSQGRPVPAQVDSAGRLIHVNENFIQNIEEVDANNTFIGKALIGTGDNEAKWQIIKVIVNGVNTTIRYADGSVEFDKVWNDRTTYTY